MKIYILINLLLGLVINVFAISKSLLSDTLKNMITEDDIKLFQQGLWFLNDTGDYVQATLEIPTQFTIFKIPMKSHVYFYLYTRNSIEDPETITIGDTESLKKTHFDPTKETKFVTHGWINSKNSKACTLIKDAFLKVGDYNVIVIDWSKIALRPYVWAATHVLDVAKYVSQMIDFLEEQGIDLKKVTLTGHSLGAHVVGLASYYAKNKVNYVVGLDPALPLFHLAGVGTRISIEDATQVEIIHTNAGLLGYLSAIGKADFYPNGGTRQLGCVVDIGGACSHARSYEFFAESIITPVGFYGVKCDSYSNFEAGKCKGESELMGGQKNYLPHNGVYYLNTKSDYPYAKGKI